MSIYRTRIVLLTSAVAFAFTLAADVSFAETGCVLKNGSDPSVPARYNPGRPPSTGANNNDNPGTPPSVSGGGVIPCYPKDKIDNGERQTRFGKEYVKIGDTGLTEIRDPDHKNKFIGLPGTWINLTDYPYEYQDIGTGTTTEDIQNINNKNNDQDGRLNDHDKQISDIHGTDKWQDTRLDNIDGTDKWQNTRLDNVEAKDQYQDTRLDGHDQQIADIHNKDNEQDGRLNDHDKQISDIHGTDKWQDTRLDNIEGTDKWQDTRLDNIEAKDKYQDTRLDGHDQQIADIHNKDNEQDGRLNDHDQQIADIHNKDNEQDGRLNDHDKQIADIHNKDNEQDGRLDGHDQQIADIHNKDNEQDGRLNDHDKQIADIHNKDNEQDGRLDGHDQQIADIHNKDNEQDGRLDGHDQQIADINSGAVFYNRDEKLNKTGGVTLNDGVSSNGVQLGNVADGKTEKDAANFGQLKNVGNSIGGGAGFDENGKWTQPIYKIGGKEYDNVNSALEATNKLGVQYVAGSDGQPTNTVKLIGDGTGSPVSITNVKAGTQRLDAVNKDQFDQLLSGLGGGAHIDQNGKVVAPTYVVNGNSYNSVSSAMNAMTAYNQDQFSRLDGRISDVRKEARGGIAGAGALAAMRYDNRPGKLSLASGIGGFKNAQAMSLGLGYTTVDGVFRMNAGASYDFQGEGTVWNVGLGWTLN